MENIYNRLVRDNIPDICISNNQKSKFRELDDLKYVSALNEELKYRQIHVLAICPYWVETEFFDRAVEKDKKPVVIRYGKVYKAKDVIKKAIKDMESSKDVSLYGTINRIQILGMKVLPHRLVKKIWMIYQELDGTKEIR